MFDRLDLPSLRLGMNPRLGMVAVPTWVWAEGYDGSVIPLTDNLVLAHQECQRVVDRDAAGAVVLDAASAPVTQRECRAVSDTLRVELRVWPRAYAWSFGDEQGTTIRCGDLAPCRAGLGLPYTSPRTPSPIAHAYRWTSLGRNGDADAYTIRLAITFGAQFRFSTNGASPSGWESLGDRDLAWTATHRVQEAQAVLPGPETRNPQQSGWRHAPRRTGPGPGQCATGLGGGHRAWGRTERSRWSRSDLNSRALIAGPRDRVPR